MPFLLPSWQFHCNLVFKPEVALVKIFDLPMYRFKGSTSIHIFLEFLYLDTSEYPLVLKPLTPSCFQLSTLSSLSPQAPVPIPNLSSSFSNKLPKECAVIPMTICCCCCCYVASVVSDSVRPQRQQPTQLPYLWDSPGKTTGVGCCFLPQCMTKSVLPAQTSLLRSRITYSKANWASPPERLRDHSNLISKLTSSSSPPQISSSIFFC